MRAVVMSMKPQWWEKILAREKTMEIRKTMPRGGAGGTEPWPMLVLVYVSGTGEIQGQFLCGGWVKTNLLAGMENSPVSRCAIWWSTPADRAGASAAGS